MNGPALPAGRDVRVVGPRISGRVQAGSCGHVGDEASILSIKEEANREKGLSCGST